MLRTWNRFSRVAKRLVLPLLPIPTTFRTRTTSLPHFPPGVPGEEGGAGMLVTGPKEEEEGSESESNVFLSQNREACNCLYTYICRSVGIARS